MQPPENLRKPYRPRTHAEARRRHVDLTFSDQELAQVDKCARDMGWTRLDVIRNCCANGTDDIQSFVKGCDSPILKTAWKFALVMSTDAEAVRVRELMDQVEKTREARHAEQLQPQLYDDDPRLASA